VTVLLESKDTRAWVAVGASCWAWVAVAVNKTKARRYLVICFLTELDAWQGPWVYGLKRKKNNKIRDKDKYRGSSLRSE